MGSGHILVYMFDVLVQLYEACGYPTRDAVASIVQNNLWGLDIDDRAAQLAYFAVMMKARQYDRGWFRRGIQPHVMAIQESNGINRSHLRCLGNTLSDLERNSATTQIEALLDAFIDAKEYGSVLRPQISDWEALRRFVRMTVPQQQTSLDEDGIDVTQERLMQLIGRAEALTQKYHAVVTNPPYMGASGMSAKLSDFVKKHYPDSKSDLFAVFIERCKDMTQENGYQAMITQHAWMFLSSFERLREKLLTTDIVNMAHLGARAFEEIGGEVVQTTSFVMRKSHIAAYHGTYCRLIEPTTQQGKEDMFLAGENRYTADQSNFSKIPGAPVAYWVSDKLREAFENELLYNHSISPSQNVTGNNARFVRKHWEMNRNQIGGKDAWIFYAKGGGYRKWWGNLEDIVNWTPEARQIYQFGDGKHASQIINKDYWYRKGITWGLITSVIPSFRVMPEGATYDKGGSTVIVDEDVYLFTLALLNSNVYLEIVSMLNPTLNFQVKDVRLMPLVLKSKDVISNKAADCVRLSKIDWDSYETSWDFKRHPLVSGQWAENSDQWAVGSGQHEENSGQWAVGSGQHEENSGQLSVASGQHEENSGQWAVTSGQGEENSDQLSVSSCQHEENSGQWSVSSGQSEDKKTNHYPLTTNHLKMRYEDWKGECEARFQQLKQNEEALNRIFISIYGLQDELTPDVADKDVTVHRVFDTKDDVPESMKGSNYVRTMRDEIVSLISYAVGCMFGRYSLDVEGLAYAGGEFSGQWSVASGQCEDKTTNHYPLTTNHYPPDADGILPITDDDYFADDIVTLLVRWVETVYGTDTLEENLKFIANALYPNGGGTARERIRRYFLDDFYADHLKTYQKRPIYWLFDAGKKNSLKCLIYLHRYRPDTVARVRTDYVHEMQARYRTAIEELTRRVDTANGAERVRLQKTLTKLQGQDAELRKYEEKIHHYADMMLPLDLDDGVKVNYAKLQDVLAPIK